MATSHACFHCGKSTPKTRVCKGCHAANFCSVACAEAEWPEHRLACGPSLPADAPAFSTDMVAAYFRADGSHFAWCAPAAFPTVEEARGCDARRRHAGHMAVARFHYGIDELPYFSFDAVVVAEALANRAACECMVAHHDVVRTFLVTPSFLTERGGFVEPLLNALVSVTALPAGAAAFAACDAAMRAFAATLRAASGMRVARHEQVAETILHLACHGVLTPDVLQRSGLADAIAVDLGKPHMRIVSYARRMLRALCAVMIASKMYEPFMAPLNVFAHSNTANTNAVIASTCAIAVNIGIHMRFVAHGSKPRHSHLFLPVLNEIISTQATFHKTHADILTALAYTPLLAALAVRGGLMERVVAKIRPTATTNMQMGAVYALRSLLMHECGRQAARRIPTLEAALRSLPPPPEALPIAKTVYAHALELLHL